MTRSRAPVGDWERGTGGIPNVDQDSSRHSGALVWAGLARDGGEQGRTGVRRLERGRTRRTVGSPVKATA